MRLVRIFVTIVVIATISCDNSVNIEPTDETHFVKYYGLGGSQFAKDMLPESDGFVILANSNIDEDNTQAYLIRTDEFGDELWSSTFGSDLHEDVISIDKTTSGGYVVAGTIDNGAGLTDIKVWILDQNGVPLDSTLFGKPEYSETVSEISTIADGGFMITASTDEPINGRLSSILLLRTQPGSLNPLTENQWSTIHGEGTVSTGVSLFQFNNQYFTLGTTDSNNPQAGGIQGLKFIFFPLNETGTPGTATFFGEDNDQIAQKLLKTEGGFVLLGNTENAGNADIYLQKVSNGLAKQATLKITQRNIKAIDVVDTGLGYLILGNERVTIDDRNIYLTLIDKNPSVGTQSAIQIWERTFGGVNLDSAAKGLCVLTDGSIVFAATIELGNQSKVALIKVNKNGDLG